MKRVLIGGFLMLIGTIWGLAICIFCGMNLTDAWPTAPGRFLKTAGICDFRERVFYERRKVKEFSKTEKQLPV